MLHIHPYRVSLCGVFVSRASSFHFYFHGPRIGGADRFKSTNQSINNSINNQPINQRINQSNQSNQSNQTINQSVGFGVPLGRQEASKDKPRTQPEIKNRKSGRAGLVLRTPNHLRDKNFHQPLQFFFCLPSRAVTMELVTAIATTRTFHGPAEVRRVSTEISICFSDLVLAVELSFF